MAAVTLREVTVFSYAKQARNLTCVLKQGFSTRGHLSWYITQGATSTKFINGY